MDKNIIDIPMEVESVVEVPVETIVEVKVEVPTYENDYNNLINKPCLDGVVLKNDTTLVDVGVDKVTNGDIDELWNTLVGNKEK